MCPAGPRGRDTWAPGTRTKEGPQSHLGLQSGPDSCAEEAGEAGRGQAPRPDQVLDPCPGPDSVPTLMLATRLDTQDTQEGASEDLEAEA